MDKSITVVRKTVVLEPFVKLVRLLVRIFYDNYTPESDNQQKSVKNVKGSAVIVLDALTRRQWVREEDLAKEVKRNAKELRKLIRHFEEQKFVMRYHRKETAKRAKMYSYAVGGTTDGRAEDNVKFHTHSYCCLDYAQIYDIVRYKLHRLKKKFKDELEDRNTVQEYGCPNCKRKYNALDALRLISMEDDSFHCENCNGELVMECNKLISEEVVDRGDNARRRQREKVKVWLQDLEGELKPLMELINRVKDLPFPAFEPFPAWEARAAKAARENGDFNPDDPSRSLGGYGSTPMPFLGETKVEVNLGEGNEDVTSTGGDSSLKMLPPWMIKQGMKLTEEQRGEMRQEANVDGEAAKLSDDKKSVMENGDDNKDLKDEYLKAYYAAIMEQQKLAAKLNEQESAGESTTTDIESATTYSDRQVGMKSKREEEEEDVEWEEGASVAANGNYKVDLNVEAEEAEEKEDGDEDDDIDWEEG
ncbi:Transcription factor TFIIE, alpha subunit [Arabidopsis thaliana]|jgi:transcription initiation factor TFIIE subunit alpha|uniref:Transcription factor TFIIE, alpha subunit n=2 Tax=Arabidopsis thaliana TaxID=3702 RepID=F4JUV3_ARATH|nr:Transcription factor TFIIE, alpha subunit [Arabidopsis thaliana]NP_193767.2 Transcription factor TFIIE, alpha subunit [Arabidopsis thaliana]AEE84310.1 Transcription factor TFIIE, alpha subunit [Arabidopsis thaliana]ANM68049.1 Transcription factor TFIIE, alpha subunit [Arabidopsis thaliana]|eukprot:NP_001329830.1 Transcription factor TFIIE, alpha subunit [Arabidopsis thaliana]